MTTTSWRNCAATRVSVLTSVAGGTRARGSRRSVTRTFTADQVVFAAAAVGFYLPDMFVSNQIQRRQTSIMQAFPDALDLLLICVESGMSIEAAFTRVAAEIGTQSIELAEEFGLTTAELSYLPDRRVAFENLAKRCGHPGVKAISAALNQAEKYGTPLGQALRVTAQENREMRMQEAERKAAALPAKLTVPEEMVHVRRWHAEISARPSAKA